MWVVNTVRARARASACSSELAVAVAGQLERRQRGVALVEVDHPGLVAHRAQGADAADAEQRVLGQPGLRVAVVQAPGDPALERTVLGQSLSSRNSGTRPTSTRQMRAADLGVADRDRDRQRLSRRRR